ncbi:inorganic phosphate transporter [Catenuloplanes japonicus]|uniref:inorganic phosphate transporter n=1 Tax=Catenuloplanes japonicus TaxID=33876 RepID=UPI0005272FA6|nr:inorganic phosphate transporter [Catenuloplanes japonicus]
MLVALAAANGANDVSKGVATLAGAGVAAYRVAILWGAATTLIGGLLSIQLGRGMGSLFSKGIVDATPSTAFALAVLLATAAWVLLASLLKLPVSTTHAIVGSLVGAGFVLAPGSVQWSGVVQKVVLPLLLSIVVAYALSLVLGIAAKAVVRWTDARQAAADRLLVAASTGEAGTAVEAQARSVEHNVSAASRTGRVITILHWISSGATGCARGLNDTPKIAAIGGFALVPAGFSATAVSVLVILAMAGGSLAGIRVARTLGEKVLKMSHVEGLTANLTTAGLVGSGALLALPMSTTQVSTGAIVGAAGGQLSRLSGSTLRDFAIAWLITPVFGALVAALAYTVLR